MHIIHINTNKNNTNIEISNNENNNLQEVEDDCDEDEERYSNLTRTDESRLFDNLSSRNLNPYNEEGNSNLASSVNLTTQTSNLGLNNDINLTLNDEATSTTTSLGDSSMASSSSLMLSNYFFGVPQTVPHILQQPKEEPGLLTANNTNQRPSSLALFPFIHQQQPAQQDRFLQSPLDMIQINFLQNSSTPAATPHLRSTSAFYNPTTINYPSTSSLYTESPNTPNGSASTLTYHAAAAYNFSPSALDFGMLWNVPTHWSLGAAAVAANEVIQ